MRHTRFQAAIVRDESILLIQHHSISADRYYWVIPGGGIEAGESEIACVRREAREETGLEVRVERLLVDARVPAGRFYQREKTFLCTPIGGVAAPGVEPEEAAANFEITAVRWFALADPRGWSGIDAADWVVPQLYALRAALGYPESESPPPGAEPSRPLPRFRSAVGRLRIREIDADDRHALEALHGGGGRNLIAPPAGEIRIDPGTLCLARLALVAEREPGGVAALAVVGDTWTTAHRGVWPNPLETGLHLKQLVATADVTPGEIESLVDAVAEYAAERGYPALRCCVDERDAAGMERIAALGFHHVGSSPAPESWYCYELAVRE